MRGRAFALNGPHGALEKARPYLLTAMIPIVVLATGSLVLEYGFRVAPDTYHILHWIELIALAGMMLDLPLRLLLARDRWAMLRFRWLEFAVAVAFVLAVTIYHAAGFESPRRLTLFTVQIAIVVSVVIRLTEVHRFLATLRVRPALILIGSFATLIAAGTGLLLLPAATAAGKPDTSFMDALFTATSAVCVTGLTVVDTGKHFTSFGQYVIVTLIQIGGLGLMTFGSVFALFLWRGMRLREAMVMREVVSHDLAGEVRRIVLFILIATFCIEGVGALLMLGAWDAGISGGPATGGDRLYYSIFHSVSAFCNAGFGLYGDNLMAIRHTWQVNVIIAALIILGGLGFGVLYNVVRMVRYGVFSRDRLAPLVKRRLTLQSKLAILMTAVLLVGGTVLVYIFETYQSRAGVWQATTSMAEEKAKDGGAGLSAVGGVSAEEKSPLGDTGPERLVNAWFLSVSSRTAGFNSTDTTRLSPPTKFLVVVLMFIGASPGSTGGGIKTVTFAVICLGIWSALRGRPHAQVFHRTIPWDTVTKALAVMAVAALLVAAVSMMICAWGLRDGARFTFLDVLFETTSAFGTVGLSTGATPILNTFGRLLIIVTMFLGRIGPLTLLLTLQRRGKASARYTYPTENVTTS
jgi:trk system potassium uptake protein TrkH